MEPTLTRQTPAQHIVWLDVVRLVQIFVIVNAPYGFYRTQVGCKHIPSSYNQKRTIMLNYEVLAGIYPMRKNHKLDEWVEFCKWIESLPYSEIIVGEKKEN